MGNSSNQKDEKEKGVEPRVILTKKELESIVEMMAKEDGEGKKGGKDAAKAILTKYGCMGG